MPSVWYRAIPKKRGKTKSTSYLNRRDKKKKNGRRVKVSDDDKGYANVSGKYGYSREWDA